MNAQQVFQKSSPKVEQQVKDFILQATQKMKTRGATLFLTANKNLGDSFLLSVIGLKTPSNSELKAMQKSGFSVTEVDEANVQLAVSKVFEDMEPVQISFS